MGSGNKMHFPQVPTTAPSVLHSPPHRTQTAQILSKTHSGLALTSKEVTICRTRKGNIYGWTEVAIRLWASAQVKQLVF